MRQLIFVLLLSMVVWGCSKGEKTAGTETTQPATQETAAAKVDQAAPAATEGEAAPAATEEAAQPATQETAAAKVDQTVQEAKEGVQQAASAAADKTQELAQSATTAAQDLVAKAETAYDATAGKAIYTANCAACHGYGVAGAPKVGDAAAWKDRIAGGVDTLVNHAINGYQGAAGYMPAKGGHSSLSDADVGNAVAYMVEQSK